jgi:hypothetical protein
MAVPPLEMIGAPREIAAAACARILVEQVDDRGSQHYAPPVYCACCTHLTSVTDAGAWCGQLWGSRKGR